MNYPQISHYSPKKRRQVFWECALVFFSTSAKCNHGYNHFLYTNDKAEVVINNVNIRKLLEKLGVTIIYLPFETFKPPSHLSTIFRNNFYKLEVLRALSKNHKQYSILLDSDCVWTKSNQLFDGLKNSGKLLVMEVHKTDDPKKKRQGLSMHEFGEMFRKVDPSYHIQYPKWYGGEVIGGDTTVLNDIVDLIYYYYSKLCRIADKKEITFSNGSSMLDNDEFVSSLVYNITDYKIVDACQFMKRLWTGRAISKSENNLDFSVLHLPNEKQFGIPLLFKECVDDKSKFWATNSEEFPRYLGRYFGIPERLEFEEFTVFDLAFNVSKDFVKNILPLGVYNILRSAFGRNPISNK